MDVPGTEVRMEMVNGSVGYKVITPIKTPLKKVGYNLYPI